MEISVQKPIEEETSDLTRALAARLTEESWSWDEVVGIYDRLLPGFAGRNANVPDLAKIHAEFSKEVARHILELKATGTVESLTEAIAKVDELRGLIEGSLVAASKIDSTTFAFHVRNDPTQSEEDHIRSKLGEDAQALIYGLDYLRVRLYRNTPEYSEVLLKTDSNNKSYSTQKGFYSDGLAGAYDAVNVAVGAVCAAKEAGIDLRTINNESMDAKGARIEKEALVAGLGEETATMLKMLTGGAIRFDNASPGKLYVYPDGGLYAGNCVEINDNSDPRHWAFGARRSSAE